MKRHAEYPVLAARLIRFWNDEGDAFGSVKGVHPRHALATALHDPEMVVGSPCDLPRTLQARHDDATGERLLAGRRYGSCVRSGSAKAILYGQQKDGGDGSQC